MDVRLPDGTIVQNVPDNITKAELTNKLVAAGYAKSLGGTDYSAEAPSPSFGGRVLEGIGQGFANLGRGVKQRAGMMTEQEVADARKTDAPLLNTGGGIVGSVIGQAAPALALSPVPGANTVAGSGAIGGIMGALQPTVEGEDVSFNAAKSALFGAGGHLLGKAIAGPIINRNAAPRQNLIDTARGKYGIDLPASVRTNSKPLAYLESQVATSPGGGRMADMLQRSNEQYTKAVMGEAGAAGDLATQGALEAAKKGTQGAYSRLWSQNIVKADQTLLDDFVTAQDLANRTLTPEKARVVSKQIDNILSKIKQGDVIDGDVYQMFLRPEIRGAAAGDSSLKMPLRQVQRALDEAAMRSLSKADVSAVQKLNYQYAVQKQLHGAVREAEARGGTFSPAAVKGATRQMQTGNIVELGKIGPLLREPPQSGTVPRAMSQYLLGGVPAAGVGGAYGYSEGGASGAMTGAGLGLLAPIAAGRALSSPAVQGYLSQGMIGATPKQAELLGALLRSGAITMPGLIDSTQ